MGINNSIAKYLAANKKKYNYQGSLCVLGKQEVNYSVEDVKKYVPNLPPQILSQDDFFKLLGFNSVESLDVTPNDGAEIIHNLNEPLPAYLEDKFDFIFDIGTTEHVFNVAEYMKSIVKMLKPNGVVFHATPAGGTCNHGFFNFQPTFYYSFYRANGFGYTNVDFVEMDSSASHIFSDQGHRTIVTPIANINNLNFEFKVPTYNFVFARKNAKQKLIQPIQEFYYNIFKEKDKLGGGRLPDELHQLLVGDVINNTDIEIRKKSFEI